MKHIDWADRIWQILSIGFGLFWLMLLCRNHLLIQWFLNQDTPYGTFWPLAGIFLLCCLGYGFIGWRLLKLPLKQWQMAAAIFGLALLPRVILAVKFGDFYLPTSDFARYLAYGQDFYQGNFDAIAEVAANYQMPKMAGLAVFNGLLAFLFTPTLLGMQIANGVLTALICVAIYFLMQTYHKPCALLASFLFLLYPANLLSCLVPTNHHGATLFFLLAILAYQKCWQATSIRQYGGYLLLTILLLTTSDFIHPSGIVIQLSILSFALLLLLKKNINKPRILLSVVCIFLGVSFCTSFSLNTMERAGLLHNQQSITPLFKMVLGLNAESGGTWNRQDYDTFMPLSGEEQSAQCKKIILERLQHPPAVSALMIDKVARTWFAADNIFHFYFEAYEQDYMAKNNANLLTQAEINTYLEKQQTKIGLYQLDTAYLQLLYLFMLLGLWKQRKQFPINHLGILFFIPLGWTAVIMLTEMQGRYRYPAMITIFCFAAIGMTALFQTWHSSRSNKQRPAIISFETGEAHE